MPNGNVLMVVWDKKTADEAIAAGRKKELVSEYVLPDSIVEVKPTGKTTGEVVWEWHLWDHLVQDHDSTKANYGDVAAHPELVDINFVENPDGPGPGPAARPGRRRQGGRPRPGPGEGREEEGRGREAQVDRLRRLAHAAVAAGQPGLDPRQLGRLQRRARPDRDQRARIQRDLDHRPQHDQGRGRRPHRRPLRARAATCSIAGGIRASTAPAPRPTRRSSPSTTPSGSPRPPGRGARARLQQRRAPAGRQLFVGRRAGPPGRRAGAVQARAGNGLRAQEARLELLGAEEVRLLRVLHLGRPPAPQRQHDHLLRAQRHALRGDARTRRWSGNT